MRDLKKYKEMKKEMLTLETLQSGSQKILFPGSPRGILSGGGTDVIIS